MVRIPIAIGSKTLIAAGKIGKRFEQLDGQTLQMCVSWGIKEKNILRKVQFHLHNYL